MVVQRSVLEKVHIAILAIPEALAQHFLSHRLYISPSPAPTDYRLFFICADFL
jgi:hypothetical protein